MKFLFGKNYYWMFLNILLLVLGFCQFSYAQIPRIRVISPNGVETWIAGSAYDITWSDNISENVKIELYKNDILNSTISNSTESDGTYNWTVPSDQTPDSDYRVKITSITNSSLNDSSDSYFTITEAPSIRVISPNGGENWIAGSAYDITWSDNISEKVKIELYKNDILNSTISDSTESNGTYNWTVPSDQTPASDYRVKITSITISDLNDQSDTNFTISAAPYITVTYPNGGENWIAGSAYDITWSDNISEKVKIELYKNDILNSTISDSTESNGTYNWTVPSDQTPASDYRVKITSITISDLNDQSDTNFTISAAPYITVTYPNGGENWIAGSAYDITWSDNISEKVKIELYKNDILNSTISDSTESNGTYNWTVPSDQTPASDYRVKITSITISDLNDQSDTNFTISAAPYITVTYPNGGENWIAGSAYDITWSDNISEKVKIELYKNDILNSTISDSTESNGTYNWTVPSDQTPASDYRVKITSITISDLNDQSDTNFTISAAPYITVTYPNGGENWIAGSAYDITWSDNISEKVKIELYKNDILNSTISDSTESNGTYNWTVPSDQTPASDYRVKITSITISDLNDQSDTNFTISAALYITVTYPNGGENWIAGSAYDITWSDNISEKVKIELYKNDILNSTISDSTESNGTYNWTVPSDQTPASDYRVKITSITISDLNDQSDTNFTISAAPYITVTSPIGDENWIVGDQEEITWTSSNVDSVKLEYKTNSGANWTTIVSSIPAAGESFFWTIPDTTSEDCKVRISDVYNQDVNDSSGVFTISTLVSIIELSTTHLDFGEIEVGKSKTIDIIVSNTGDTTLVIDSLNTTDPNFSITDTTLSILKNKSDTISITFSPKSIGSITGNLIIHHNAIEDSSVIMLSGNGFEYPNSIDLSFHQEFGPIGDSTNFRMIGLPGAGGINLEEIMNGVNGEDWVAFLDNGLSEDYYTEYANSPNDFVFKPGNGFWVSSKDSINFDMPISSVPVDSQYYYSIPLAADKWNIISNPFEKIIPWSNIENANNISAANYTLRYWNGSSYSEESNLAAYQGYYVFNFPPVSGGLKIPYVNNNLAKPLKKELTYQEFNITVNRNGKQYSKITAGVTQDGKEGFDDFDIMSPPGFFFDTRLLIFNEKLETSYKWLSKDYRKEIGEGQIFSLNLSTIAGSDIELSSEGVKQFENYEIYLIDKRLFTLYNMKETPSIKLHMLHSQNSYELVIGTSEFIEKIKKDLLPKEFLLYQNYPNPFNPATVIRFSIPIDTKLSVNVYNILGEKVRALINNESYLQGFYEVEFDGSELASGVYIYRIETDKFTDVKKMILIK
ncbi:MAG: choice-of-anchor D domain-containing protein [Ignavibacteriales bacterium]|nr:choice-of-anchor D domain-containing protein [Ignavibacteriales bacterium]